MELYHAVTHAMFQYYGIDWLVTFTAFACLFLIGERNRLGFAIGMLSAAFGVIFSFQIGSIANGVSSIVVFGLYLRGFMQWRETAAVSIASDATEPEPSTR